MAVPGTAVSSGRARRAPSVSTRLPPPWTHSPSFLNHFAFCASVNLLVPAVAGRASKCVVPFQAGSCEAKLSTWITYFAGTGSVTVTDSLSEGGEPPSDATWVRLPSFSTRSTLRSKSLFGSAHVIVTVKLLSRSFGPIVNSFSSNVPGAPEPAPGDDPCAPTWTRGAGRPSGPLLAPPP